MRTRTFIVRVAVTAFVLAASLPLAAWDYDHCMGSKLTWGSPNQGFRAANISFPAGHPNRTALSAMADAWNTAPSTNFRFGISYQDFSSQTMPNWSNEIIYSGNLSWNTLGETSYWSGSCANITEKDIKFNVNRQWTYDLSPYSLVTNSEPFSFPIVALHELGHGMGLNHQEYELATMSALYPSGGPVGQVWQQHFQPLPDDVAGDRAGYGSAGYARDVVASAYAVYNATQTGPIIPASQAFRGSTTGFGFSVGNRGSVNESAVRVHFYFSTDRWIDSNDYFVGATTLSINAGGFYRGPVYVTLPASFPVGTYYFGYIADPYNEIGGEADEANNAVAMGSVTQVPAYNPPSACFSKSASSGIIPFEVTFDASCSSDPDGYITSYSWSFDDGGGGYGPVVTHVFETPGNHRITLTVTDNQGYTAQYEDWVWAQDPSGCLQCF